MNVYGLIETLLGTPPNDDVKNLYYVLAAFIVIMSFKIILCFFKRGNKITF